MGFLNGNHGILFAFMYVPSRIVYTFLFLNFEFLHIKCILTHSSDVSRCLDQFGFLLPLSTLEGFYSTIVLHINMC